MAELAPTHLPSSQPVQRHERSRNNSVSTHAAHLPSAKPAQMARSTAAAASEPLYWSVLITTCIQGRKKEYALGVDCGGQLGIKPRGHQHHLHSVQFKVCRGSW